MALSYTTFRHVAPVTVALSSDNRIIRTYPRETALLDGSNLCFRLKESGLSVCLTEEAIVVDLLDPRLRNQIELPPDQKLSALRQGPWVVSGIDRWAFKTLSPESQFVLNIQVTEPWDDQHALVTREAIDRLGSETTLPFFGRGNFAVTQLTKEIGYQDHPPTPHGTYIDWLGIQFDRTTSNTRHGLRSLVYEEDQGKIRLQTIPEARRGIRDSMESLLTDVHQIGQRLEEKPPVFLPHDRFLTLGRELQTMLQLFNSDQPARLPATVALVKKLRPSFRYSRMRDVYFPDNDSDNYENEAKLDLLIQIHRDLLGRMQVASRDFFQAARGDTPSFVQGMQHYREMLRYLPESDWGLMADGAGPLIAEGQMKLAAALHLAQDAVGAHCREFQGNVCENYVSANFFGLGDDHRDEDDRAQDADGNWKPTGERAIQITMRILEIVQIRNPGEFERAKNDLLDTYWPA